MSRRDILLDDNGNRVLSGGDYAFAEGAQAVRQGIQCRVRLFRGEYLLDTSIGVAWIERILIRNADPSVVKSEIAAAIASTPDVTGVTSVDYAFDSQSRSASASYTASSTEGEISGAVDQ